SIRLGSERQNERRTIRVRSSLLDGEVKGDFLLTDLTRDLQTAVREILLNIRNDEKALREYYAQKNYRPKSYETAFELRLKDLGPVSHLFDIDLLISSNTLLEGRF